MSKKLANSVYFLRRSMKLHLARRNVDASGVHEVKDEFGKKKQKKGNPTSERFELSRVEHNGLAVHHLNHSVNLSLHLLTLHLQFTEFQLEADESVTTPKSAEKLSMTAVHYFLTLKHRLALNGVDKLCEAQNKQLDNAFHVMISRSGFGKGWQLIFLVNFE